MDEYFDKPIAYAFKHSSSDIVQLSRSGGIFTAISDYVLSHNGAVFGCVLSDDLQAHHIKATTENDRDKMRGSKYVQSRLDDCFLEVKNELLNGKIVLFSGTSCQVAGLKCFLKDLDTTKLYLLDIVCHGVPSPLVLKKYIEWQEKENNDRCIGFDFRNKIKGGWRSHFETVIFNNKEIDSSIYSTLFYEHCILRPSCFKCPYKSIMHPGDITIADFWNIENAAPEFDDNKGVSLVLINNQKGKELFNISSQDMITKQCALENCMQPPLKYNYSDPYRAKKFWNDFINRKFDYIVKHYGGKNLSSKIIWKLKKIKHFVYTKILRK